MGYPRTATPELLERIERVCRMRLAAEAVTDQQIADAFGVRRSLVSRWMGAIRKAIISGGQPDKAGTDTAFHVEQGSERT